MKMLDYANEKGVPVWTAFNLLDFLKMKDEASFSNISWRKNVLSFNLNSSLKHSAGLTFMVPAMFSGKKIGSVIKDNKETAFGIQKVKGKDYAFVTVNGGSNYGINVSYR
jgi:GTP-sensing pleiotropic transcriptional regulator CodY